MGFIKILIFCRFAPTIGIIRHRLFHSSYILTSYYLFRKKKAKNILTSYFINILPGLVY